MHYSEFLTPHEDPSKFIEGHLSPEDAIKLISTLQSSVRFATSFKIESTEPFETVIKLDTDNTYPTVNQIEAVGLMSRLNKISRRHEKAGKPPLEIFVTRYKDYLFFG